MLYAVRLAGDDPMTIDSVMRGWYFGLLLHNQKTCQLMCGGYSTNILRGIVVTNQNAGTTPAQHLGGPNPCDEKSSAAIEFGLLMLGPFSS
jgi:hypothetical protein